MLRLACGSPPPSGLSCFLHLSLCLQSLNFAHTIFVRSSLIGRSQNSTTSAPHTSVGFCSPKLRHTLTFVVAFACNQSLQSLHIEQLLIQKNQLQIFGYCSPTMRFHSFLLSRLVSLKPTLEKPNPQSKKPARPSAAGSSHPSPYGLPVCQRGLHSQSARTAFLRFGATRSYLSHCTYAPPPCSRLFFLTTTLLCQQVTFDQVIAVIILSSLKTQI